MLPKHQGRKLIWDLPLRIWHWSIVLVIGYSWYSVEISGDMEHHFIAGHCALALVSFRILWGWFGTEYARFRSFIFPPGVILIHIKQFLSKQPGKYAGHNPLGGLSVLVLIILIVIQISTGLFANDGYYVFGPLAQNISSSLSTTITELHNLNFNVLLIFIAIHILSITFYLLFKKENFIQPMFSGKKSGLDNNKIAIKNSKLVLASLLISITSAAAYLIFNIK